MSNGVISLDDLESSGNDGGSTESDNSGDAFAELREACDAIGADVDTAIERVKNDGGVAEDDLIEFANELADDDELWEVQEAYRAMMGQRRINENFLRSADKEFTDWTAAFYGDSSTDETGRDTYNQMQNLSREMGGNLYYYKALFPEPDAEHFPGEPVCWMERPDDDSHIYVAKEFCEEYADYTLEIGGKERPVPPWNGSTGSSTDEEGDAIDPREMTIDELKEVLDDLSNDELESLLEVEQATKDRKGAKKAINRAIDDDSSGDDEPDEITVTINGEEVTGAPEDIRALKGL